MTQLDRLRALPAPSPAMLAYIEALADFIIEDTPGPYRPPAGRIRAFDIKDAAWAALSYQEKEIVRACGEGR